MTDYQCGRTVVEGRTFLIEFWQENHFGLPWVRVSEVKTREVKRYWLFGDLIKKEYIEEIDDGWTAENRLEWAMNRIMRHTEEEARKKSGFKSVNSAMGYLNKSRISSWTSILI